MKHRAIERAALAATLLTTACRSRSEIDGEQATQVRVYADELGIELVSELTHVVDVLTPGRALLAVALIALVVLLRRVLQLAVQVAWRLGWDPKRRLARLRSYAELLLLLGVGLLLAWMVFKVVPLLTSLGAISIALVCAIALPGGLQDLAAGIALAGRRRFLEGDQIELGPHGGTVRHIGLVRTMLRRSDGTSLWLPNRDVVRLAVQVGREQQALPLSIELPPLANDPDRREHLRQVAHLSPYRRSGSRPAVVRDGERWLLTLQTWCTRQPDLVTRAVDSQLRREARRWEAPS